MNDETSDNKIKTIKNSRLQELATTPDDQLTELQKKLKYGTFGTLNNINKEESNNEE